MERGGFWLRGKISFSSVFVCFIPVGTIYMHDVETGRDGWYTGGALCMFSVTKLGCGRNPGCDPPRDMSIAVSTVPRFLRSWGNVDH